MLTTDRAVPGDRFTDALVCATQWHAGQRRKGTTIPYIAHLLGVASLALEAGADEDLAIAALLHDAVEDAGDQQQADRRAEEIRVRFRPRVLDAVLGCTDAGPAEKAAEAARAPEDRRAAWRARKERYIHHLRSASPDVRLVSAADKLHNARAVVADLRTLGDALWTRFNGGKEGTLWYYRALADAFAELGPAALAGELGRVAAEMEVESARHRDR